LGAALAELGQRVLLIDTDAQANATTAVGVNWRVCDVTMYQVLLDEVPLADAVVATEVPGLWLAPSSLDLAGADLELVSAFSRELRLRRAIDTVRDTYDVILIDCPPSLGLITVNALAAADEVLVPVQCEYFALEGLGQLLQNVELVQRSLNPSLVISTLVLVMFDARTKLAEQVGADVRAHFPTQVCRTVIPRSVRLSEAPSYGQPITIFDPTSRGALAYRDLAREVLDATP
jgi:chromosome partitioning protein